MNDVARQALKEMFDDLYFEVNYGDQTKDGFLEECVDLTISMVNAVKVVSPVSTNEPCWLPISTAPKDGTYVLLAGPPYWTYTPLNVRLSKWCDDRTTWLTESNKPFNINGTEPIYWQPLPQIPSNIVEPTL